MQQHTPPHDQNSGLPSRPNRVLRLSEFCHRLGIGRSTYYQLRASNQIKAPLKLSKRAKGYTDEYAQSVVDYLQRQARESDSLSGYDPETNTGNIALARELVLHLVPQTIVCCPENQPIFDLLIANDDDEYVPLPGNTIEVVKTNLKQAVCLASEAVSRPSGKDKAARLKIATDQRSDLRLVARVALSLFEVISVDGDHA